MSRYKGNDDACPHGCGLRYGHMRTGLRYYDVFVMLMDYSDDPADWRRKSRGVVLGKWHEIKQSLWTYHTDEGGCPRDPRNLDAEHSCPIQRDCDRRPPSEALEARHV